TSSLAGSCRRSDDLAKVIPFPPFRLIGTGRERRHIDGLSRQCRTLRQRLASSASASWAHRCAAISSGSTLLRSTPSTSNPRRCAMWPPQEHEQPPRSRKWPPPPTSFVFPCPLVST